MMTEREEALVYSGAGKDYRPDYLEKSPLGKVPCLLCACSSNVRDRWVVKFARLRAN